MSKYKLIDDIVIHLPDGYEIDVENTTDDNIIIIKSKAKVLPKRWEDIDKLVGYYINAASEINRANTIDIIKENGLWRFY